jgi:hypothetical protein
MTPFPTRIIEKANALADRAGIPTPRNMAAVSRAARRFAISSLDDEEAVTALQMTTAARRRSAKVTLSLLSQERNEFEADRAYRLLEAAITGSTVESIRPQWNELFAREEQLARMPLVGAFNEICHLQPSLRELQDDIEAGRIKPALSSDGFLDWTVHEKLATLVGPRAHHDDSLVRSTLTRSLVAQYLMISTGATQYGGVDTSYFAAPRRFVIR